MKKWPFVRQLSKSVQQAVEAHWYPSRDGDEASRSTVAHYWTTSMGKALKWREQRLAEGATAALPVIVVGNITVGGTGKSPLVSALVQRLQQWGLKPGIVSRGYGATIVDPPCLVEPARHQVEQVGDEPLMLAQMTGVPVVVDPNRPRAVERLKALGTVDVVVSDDGLQHYALDRIIEIVVVDGARGFGNGQCLPLGPLREPIERLQSVDMLVVNGQSALSVERSSHMGIINGIGFRRLGSPDRVSVESWLAERGASGSAPAVTAVAGIGSPERFFESLRQIGLDVAKVSFEDHHAFSKNDFANIAGTIVITAKDAVKVQPDWAQDVWVFEIEMHMASEFWQDLKQRLVNHGLLKKELAGEGEK